MKKKIAVFVATLAVAFGVAVATPQAAEAATASCASRWSGWPDLNAYASRINYGGGKTAIYMSANQRVVKDMPWPYSDVAYTFYSATSPNLQSRYSQPTQWGSRTNPLGTANYSIKITWRGYTVDGKSRKADRYCYLNVGME